jgi:hypothetical protein
MRQGGARCGAGQDRFLGKPCETSLAINARDAIQNLGRPDILLIDPRGNSERAKHSMLSGALHAPYPSIDESLRLGGMLREVAAASGRRIVFFARSASARQWR